MATPIEKIDIVCNTNGELKGGGKPEDDLVQCLVGAARMMLRGYDAYEVTLGDEMRGERASLGRTLLDAERDLRIKANVIRAIEDCDLDSFPNDSVVAGYVRSYARYLGLDPEACYRRFCAESGFRSPGAALTGSDRSPQTGGLQAIVAAGSAFGTGLNQSRFAMTSGQVRMSARISLGGLTSAIALLALIVGLGYGGYGLLQDIQRVRVAPLPEAPDVVAEAPMINEPLIESGLVRRPNADAYQGDGVLASVAPADLPPPTLPPRDGPISAIDPATSGVFREISERSAIYSSARPDGPRRSDGPGREIYARNDAIVATRADAVQRDAVVVPSGPPTIVIHATDTAWIRVNDGDAAIVYEGTLSAGGRYEISSRVDTPLLRTGNAGAVYVLIGEAAYGPVGGSGGVIKNLSLLAADIESRIPPAASGAIVAVRGDDQLQRSVAVANQ